MIMKKVTMMMIGMITMMIKALEKALEHKDNDNDDVSNKQSHSSLIHHPSMPI